jgi:hypothetical protein
MRSTIFIALFLMILQVVYGQTCDCGGGRCIHNTTQCACDYPNYGNNCENTKDCSGCGL